MPNIITKVDSKFAYQTTKESYPHLFIENITDAFPVLVSCLEDGDIPLCVSHKGTVHCLDKKVSCSPLNLRKLLNVYSIVVVESKDVQYKVTNIEELMELGFWWEGV